MKFLRLIAVALLCLGTAGCSLPAGHVHVGGERVRDLSLCEPAAGWIYAGEAV